MYVGVDIGGTKTLVAVIDEHAVIREQTKFPTPQNYEEFCSNLAAAVATFTTKDFKAAGVAAPGRLDRQHGRIIALGNLPWKNEPLQADCEKVLGCPVIIENDANLAALSEAMLHKDKDTVLYLTISTGIGGGVVYKQQLDPALLNSEVGHMELPYRGEIKKWESFASGKAIYNRYNKKAMDIHDEETWQAIVRTWALGFFELIAVVQPDLIIIGGSVGVYFDRYKDLLTAELKKYELPVVPLPPIVEAQRPEEAVVFGCYDLAKQVFGHAKHA